MLMPMDLETQPLLRMLVLRLQVLLPIAPTAMILSQQFIRAEQKYAMVLTTIAMVRLMKVYCLLFTAMLMPMDLETQPLLRMPVFLLQDLLPTAPTAMILSQQFIRAERKYAM